MELGSRTALHLSFRGEEKGVAWFVYQVWNWHGFTTDQYSMNSGIECCKLKIHKFWDLKHSNPKFINCIKISLFWNFEIKQNLSVRYLQYPFKTKILFTSALEQEVTTVLVKHRISHLRGALMFILWSQGSRTLQCCRYKWAPIVPSCHGPCRAAAAPDG